ncbi:MAG: rhodanese-like domain-containing protein [Armatimonadetes bacterium]|nr:rhodanese-like domain-containing protein [Armatimonadota bacterium]
MKRFSKLLGMAVGAAAVLGVGGALFITKTERGFRLFLDWMYTQKFPDVPLITPDSLAVALATRTPPLLLDVRAPEEFAVSRLRGARRVDSDTLADLDEIDLAGIDRDHPIVAYCSIGYRSGVIVRQLHELGFTNVRNLYGGIFLWHNQGRDLWAGDSLSGDSPSDKVHPYNWMWGQFVQ